MKKAKLISLFILFSVTLLSNNVVNLKLQNERLSVAMKLMTKQTGVEFSYNPQVVNPHRLISVSIVNKDVKTAIDLLIGDMYLYTLKGRYVIITSVKKQPDIVVDTEPIAGKYEKKEIKSSGNTFHSGLSSIGDSKIANERIEMNSPLLINNKENEKTMLKTIAGIISLATFTWSSAEAQQKQPKAEKAPTPKIEYNIGLQKSTAQLSFVSPLSTDGNSAKDKEYKFSLNILGGVTGGINGVELGGLFNINKQDMRGLQMAGIFNSTGGAVSGLQMAGVVNIARKATGFQMSGVANYSGGINDVQMAGVVNVSEGSRLQIAAVANYAKGADVQIGVVNIAQRAGFQVGIINLSGTDDAAMLGILNLVKEGGLFEVGISANDYVYGAANLITGTDKLYSILSFGVSSSNRVVGVGVGTRVQLGDSPRGIHFELMHNQIYKNNFKNKGRDAALEQAKILYSVRKNKFTIYGGPTINVLHKDADFTEVKDPVYSIFKDEGSKYNFNLWAGAEIGVRFNFK